MTIDTKSTNGFWDALLSDPRSLGMLLVVCAVIAFITNAVNDSGYLINVMFSLSFGIPISMIETFLRTRKKPLNDILINVLSLALGCIFGSAVVYGYLVKLGIMPFGYFGSLLYLNFGVGFFFSAIAFYFFWSRYRNQTLTLALREQQLSSSKSESLRQQAENRLLQSQMEPHFLFNTLANIQSLIDVDPVAAKNMIADLSIMLRSTLKNTTQNECSLNQELAIVRAYLSIQKIRIGDRLKVYESIAEQAGEVKIPPMIIQPLVENCIKHGVEHVVGDADISIDIVIEAERLVITVQDNCNAKKTGNSGHGISLKNISQRLLNKYGKKAEIISDSNEYGWCSKLSLPLKVDGELN